MPPWSACNRATIFLFGQSTAAVVSTVATTAVTNGALYSAAYNVTFALGDPGHINQPTATSGSLKQLFTAGTLVSAARLLLITYYLDISPSDGVTPRLMRLQSGKAPYPVAENVSYLKFSYDVDNNGVITAGQTSLPAGVTPNMITKVNIVHMTIRSQLHGTSGLSGTGSADFHQRPQSDDGTGVSDFRNCVLKPFRHALKRAGL